MDEAALIAKIVGSRTFRSSDNLGPLLQFLYDNRQRRILARDIETDHFGHPETGHQFSPMRARERVLSLKDFLERYSIECPDDELQCSIADGKGGQGYFPIFKKVKAGYAATSMMWEPHFVHDKSAALVCDSLLFFYNHELGRMVRYVDTNIEGINRVEAKVKLDALHPEHRDESLVIGHFYVDVGAVIAADLLKEHFWKVWDSRVPLFVEKEQSTHTWINGSPILISTVRTNTFTKRIFDSPEASGLRYSIHKDRFAWVTIKDATTEERAKLKKFKDTTAWVDGENLTTIVPEMTLGVLTRIPNPVKNGEVLTFISSDATRNATQMAVALTDEKQLRRLLDQMKWPYTRPLPDTFEMLFLVKLFPGNLDDQASAAELLLWRTGKRSASGEPGELEAL
jgi:hypothetical protein